MKFDHTVDTKTENRTNLQKLAEPQDWPDDFPHENGIYMCTCAECGGEFTGHKRRLQCKLCFNKNSRKIIEKPVMIGDLTDEDFPPLPKDFKLRPELQSGNTELL